MYCIYLVNVRFLKINFFIAQSAGVVEYTDCTAAEG